MSLQLCLPPIHPVPPIQDDAVRVEDPMPQGGTSHPVGTSGGATSSGHILKKLLSYLCYMFFFGVCVLFLGFVLHIWVVCCVFGCFWYVLVFKKRHDDAPIERKTL